MACVWRRKAESGARAAVRTAALELSPEIAHGGCVLAAEREREGRPCRRWSTVEVRARSRGAGRWTGMTTAGAVGEKAAEASR